MASPADSNARGETTLERIEELNPAESRITAKKTERAVCLPFDQLSGGGRTSSTGRSHFSHGTLISGFNLGGFRSRRSYAKYVGVGCCDGVVGRGVLSGVKGRV